MTHQGFAGSVGTSALLIGAALTILLVVGAVIAFEGFPGPSGEGPSETVVLEASTDPASRPDPQLILDAARDAPRDTPGEAGAGSGAPAGSPDFFSPSTPGTASAPPTVAPEPGSSSAPSVAGEDPTDPSGPDGSSAGSDGSGPIGSTVDNLSDGVRETSNALDGVVERVLPDGGLEETLPDRGVDIGPLSVDPSLDGLSGVGQTLDGVGRGIEG